MLAVIRHGDGKQAAVALGMNYHTMRNHLSQIRERLGFDTTLQAAIYWATRYCECGNAETVA